MYVTPDGSPTDYSCLYIWINYFILTISSYGRGKGAMSHQPTKNMTRRASPSYLSRVIHLVVDFMQHNLLDYSPCCSPIGSLEPKAIDK